MNFDREWWQMLERMAAGWSAGRVFSGLDARAATGTLVWHMPSQAVDRNCTGLMQAGLAPETPAVVLQRNAPRGSRLVEGTLGDVPNLVVTELSEASATVVIGVGVGGRSLKRWFEQRALFGRTVAVTRTHEQSASLIDALRDAGGQVVEAPTLVIEDVKDPGAADKALSRLSRYDWLVLTSANGVRALFERLRKCNLDARALAGVRIAVVGRGTSAFLTRWGIRPDLLPDEAVGEALAAAMIREGVSGQGVLLFRAEKARSILPEMLVRAGARVDDVPVYRAVPPASLPDLFIRLWESGRIDWITVTSPSCFENLLNLLGPQRLERLRGVKLASIGPVTTKAIRAAGFHEAVEANPHDTEGLAAAILESERARA